jgi:predicted DCC family thiol-disulfide oxidoreductase YuxK
MSTIHGVLEDGTLVTGMEVFRGAYRAVGLGWVLAPTGWTLFRPFFDLLYRSFARHRLRLTGRCADERCVTSDGAAAGWASSPAREA